MKTLLFLIFTICFFNVSSTAQSCVWGKGVGGANDDFGYDVHYDAAGNEYMIGTTSGTTDLDPGPGVFTCGTSTCYCLFLSKFSPSGVFLWAKSWDCQFPTNSAKRIYSLDIDHGDNILIGGSFLGTTDFDPGPGVFALTSQGSSGSDIFVLKLDNNGNFIWAKSIGCPYYDDFCYGLKADANNNVFFAGKISSASTDLDPGPGVYQPAGVYGAFYLDKLNNNGDFIWGQRGENFGPEICSVTVDPHGSVILAGNFTNDVDLDTGPGTNILTYTGAGSGVGNFVAKYGSAGNLIFAEKIDCPALTGQPGFATAVTDPAGNILMTGTFHGTADMDPGPGVHTLTSGANDDIYIVKLTNAGQYIFAKQIGTANNLNCFATTAAPDGNFILTGVFTNTIDFDPGPGVHTGSTNPGNEAVFVLKLNSSGTYIWHAQILGAQGNNHVMAVAIDAFNNVCVTGYADYTSVICGINPGYGFYDIFLTKLAESDVISGKIFSDINGNGVVDAGDTPIGNVLVKAVASLGNNYAVSDSNGIYAMRVNPANYTITPSPVPTIYNINPSSQTANFGTQYGGTDSLNNFGLQAIGAVNDLRVSVTALTLARPGNNNIYRITYTNQGNTVQSGNVMLTHAPQENYLSAAPSPFSYTNPVLVWNYTNLKPFETRNIDVVFNLPVNSVIGTLISSNVVINPVISDASPADNTDTVVQQIRSSFDPNLKVVSPSGDVPLSFITNGQYLYYTIHFQNTGTDTAFNVTVSDTLSSKLDPSSFQMISSSHSYVIKVDSANRFNFIFNNILLPDSNHNELLSHGFLKFRVKTQSNLVVGDKITNQASIYFDFNSSIITNTVTNNIVASVVPVTLLNFFAVPLNKTSVLKWQTTAEINALKYEIQHSTDGLLFSHIGDVGALNNGGMLTSYNFIHSNPSLKFNNYYRLKIVDNDGKFSYSSIVNLRFGDVAAITISPNPAKDFIDITYPYAVISAKLLIMNAAGGVVKSLIVPPGTSTEKIDIKALSTGIYYIQWFNGISSLKATFVVQ